MTDWTQLDLFVPKTNPRPQKPVADQQLREEARFGKIDAITGLPLHNGYSNRLLGERLAVYETAWRATKATMMSHD